MPSPATGVAGGASGRGPCRSSASGVAFAFLWPYLVMLLDAFRPSSDVVQTPPSLLPEQWKWTTFSEVLGDERFLAWLQDARW